MMSWFSQPGFLGTRAPLFPDLIICGLLLLVPAFAAGIVAGRRGHLRAHATAMQLAYATLLVVVVTFVAWSRLGYAPPAPRLEQAPFYKTWFVPFTVFHIAAAISCLLSGAGAVCWGRWRTHSTTGQPGAEGQPSFPKPTDARLHRVGGYSFCVLLLVTTLTGMTIYYYRYVF